MGGISYVPQSDVDFGKNCCEFVVRLLLFPGDETRRIFVSLLSVRCKIVVQSFVILTWDCGSQANAILHGISTSE